MRVIKVKIQELEFLQADVFGVYLPSRDSIEHGLFKIKDKRNKRAFCQRSNEISFEFSRSLNAPLDRMNFAKYADFCKANENSDSWNDITAINIGIIINIAAKCYFVGCDREEIIQSLFTLAWFDTLLYNNYSVIDDVRKATTSFIGLLEGTGGNYLLKEVSKSKQKHSKSHIRDDLPQEYQKAKFISD